MYSAHLRTFKTCEHRGNAKNCLQGQLTLNVLQKEMQIERTDGSIKKEQKEDISNK